MKANLGLPRERFLMQVKPAATGPLSLVAANRRQEMNMDKPAHYHYLTLEQRQALEGQLRAAMSGELLHLALARLHQPDYGVCIECGKDIAFARLQDDPEALHCGACARLPVRSAA
jgi:RNA polymerase-binding transcription factor DksA